MSSPQRPAPHEASLSDVFAAGLIDDSLEASSLYAWEHRWSPLPVRYSDVADAVTDAAVPHSIAQFAVRCCARRIHYAFAHETMAKFCTDALEDFPGDELLSALTDAAAAVVHDEPLAWKSLSEAASTGRAEGLAAHVFLTSVYLSPHASVESINTALDISTELALTKEPIAMYRRASMLRRAGHYREAIAAIDALNEELAAGNISPSLCDHLSERLLTERFLIIDTAQETNPPAH